MNKDEAWLFQPELSVEAVDSTAIFVGRREAVPNHDVQADEPELDLLYRHEVEFAVGHGVAVHATPFDADPTRAMKIETRVMPRYEVPRVEAPTAGEEPGLASVVLDMKVLTELATDRLVEVLRPLAEAYDGWLDRQEARIKDPGEGLGDLQAVAHDHGRRAQRCGTASCGHRAARQRRGRGRGVPFRQPGHVAAACPHASPRRPTRRGDDAVRRVTERRRRPGNRIWRPFQLAFILLNLPALTDPTHPDRSPDARRSSTCCSSPPAAARPRRTSA